MARLVPRAAAVFAVTFGGIYFQLSGTGPTRFELAQSSVEEDRAPEAVAEMTVAKEAEEALKNGDKEDIEAKSQALSVLAQSLAEKMYAEQAQENPTDGSQSDTPEEEGDVVDAEFEEVKDDKKDS